MEGSIRSTIFVALAIGSLRVSAQSAMPEAPFPLGTSGLSETRSTKELASGVTLHVVERGRESPSAPWLISAGVARTRDEQRQRANCLRQVGLKARFEHYSTPGSKSAPYVEVVGGRFTDEKHAKAATKSVEGCSLKPRSFAVSPLYGSASWRLYVVEIAPEKFKGHLYSSRGREIDFKRQTTSEIARHENALVAINGGFFVMRDSEGVVGASAGLSVVKGKVESAPTSERSYLLIKNSAPVSAAILGPPDRHLRLQWSDGSQTIINGVNRRAGSVRDCGVGTLEPAKQPAQDETCPVENDLVAITGPDGHQAETGNSENFFLHPDGRVDRSATGIGTETLLAATGRMVDILNEKIMAGLHAKLDLTYSALTDAPQSDDAYVVNGAPTLLRNGAPIHEEDIEGWAIVSTPAYSRDRLNFAHRWAVLRNPRTAAGVGPGNTIWLVVADGYQDADEKSRGSQESAGLSVEELRSVMRHLGAKDALNLDGGGSSALVINGTLVSHPSDTTGERAIGDAIVVTQ